MGGGPGAGAGRSGSAGAGESLRRPFRHPGVSCLPAILTKDSHNGYPSLLNNGHLPDSTWDS